MKILFNKLNVSSGKIFVDFGQGFQEFDVSDAKENGILIPDNCKDYSTIKIKGSSTIFKNLDVIKSIQLSTGNLNGGFIIDESIKSFPDCIIGIDIPNGVESISSNINYNDRWEPK